MKIPIFHWGLEFTLTFLGLWPEKPNIYSQLFLCSSLVFISPFQLKDLVFQDINRAQMLDGIRDMVVIILLVVKFLIMLSNRR